MKTMKEQIDEQPKIIKMFSINYARDLLYCSFSMTLSQMEDEYYAAISRI
jgi:hypothetical protein